MARKRSCGCHPVFPFGRHSRQFPGRRRRLLGFVCIIALGLAWSGRTPAGAEQILLFEERFEDDDWAARGWYDGPHMEITAAEHSVGSSHSCVWNWRETGAIGPTGGGARVHLPPVDNVVLSFCIKHSRDWSWTGVPWHPHEFHFITTADDAYVGPARTHLTFYVEVVNGVPRIAIQDGCNIVEESVGEDLTGVTESRAVAGCNGDADGYGEGDCYPSGSVHANGKYWEADSVYFGDEPGLRDKSDWHQVQVRLWLNSVHDGVGQRDGTVEYWFDGQCLFAHHDVVMRTGVHGDMRIDQFLMAPYFGPGVPHPQRIWIDDLRIYTETDRGAQSTRVQSSTTTWGTLKKRRD